MSNSNIFYDELLLGFLSRESISISDLEWSLTLAFLNERGESFSPQVIARALPSWGRIESFSERAWQSNRDELKRFQERGLIFFRRCDIPSFSRLQQIADPPRALVILGSDRVLHAMQALSVVGSREANLELLKWMDDELSQFIKKYPNVSIVSGGARGVDQQAHICAIRNQVPTLVWLPSGILKLYPNNLSHWMSAILELKGAFLSEYHPGTYMKKWYFHQRNRLIVGMSQACWVPQSKVKSGSFVSACLAADTGIPLYVNPGPPWDPNFSGNLRLLGEGAICLNSHQDLIL